VVVGRKSHKGKASIFFSFKKISPQRLEGLVHSFLLKAWEGPRILDTTYERGTQHHFSSSGLSSTQHSVDGCAERRKKVLVFASWNLS
jgi:hypothetical protein